MSSSSLQSTEQKTRAQFAIFFAFALIMVAGCAAENGALSTIDSPLPPSSASTTATGLSAAQAAAHVEERETVCGNVVDTLYARSSSGSPTFLNFDKPYPRHDFVVVIWGSQRGNFSSSPEMLYRDRNVCVTGLIELYKGKAEIVARSESQLVVQ